MTERRQALHAAKHAATWFFLAPILIFFLAPLGLLAKPDPALSGAVLLVALSAFTLVLCLCHRRDITSPRRVGRRI
jgi:hypothetical protein